MLSAFFVLARIWDISGTVGQQTRPGLALDNFNEVHMAALEKRGQYWRAKIRRKGFPDQSRSVDTRVEAEMWARAIESEMDRGLYVDRTEAERKLLAGLIDRYLREVTPSKRGAGPERSRLLALQKRPIAQI